MNLLGVKPPDGDGGGVDLIASISPIEDLSNQEIDTRP